MCLEVLYLRLWSVDTVSVCTWHSSFVVIAGGTSELTHAVDCLLIDDWNRYILCCVVWGFTNRCFCDAIIVIPPTASVLMCWVRVFAVRSVDRHNRLRELKGCFINQKILVHLFVRCILLFFLLLNSLETVSSIVVGAPPIRARITGLFLGLRFPGTRVWALPFPFSFDPCTTAFVARVGRARGRKSSCGFDERDHDHGRFGGC